MIFFPGIRPAIESPLFSLSHGIGIDSVVDSHETVRRRDMWCRTVLDASDSLEPRFLTEAICFGIERNEDETIRNAYLYYLVSLKGFPVVTESDTVDRCPESGIIVGQIHRHMPAAASRDDPDKQDGMIW